MLSPKPEAVEAPFTLPALVAQHGSQAEKDRLTKPARPAAVAFLQYCQRAKFDPSLSLDCARVEGVGAQSNERKGSNFAAQRSGAIVQKPEGPNTNDLKIWL